MKELTQHLPTLLTMIANTHERECDCGEFYRQMDEVVERLQNGEEIGAIWPEFQHHLQMCRCCSAEFALLQAMLTEIPNELNKN